MLSEKGSRALPMALGAFALGAGLWTSLSRLGFAVEGVAAINHGPLMVGGFTGTVIALERAVALGRLWGYLAPALAASSGFLLILSFPYTVAALPLLLSSLVLLAAFGVFIRREPANFTLVMAAGALTWCAGNTLLVLGRALSEVVPWWAAFFILTIAGERIAGYFWLILSGVFGVIFGKTAAGLYYDAWTHAQFVGFVLVMIMAHAPIILPAVAGIAVRFTSALYAPLLFLHASLAARIGADLMLSWSGRKWTGLLNVAAVLLFLGLLVRSALQAGVRRRTEAAGGALKPH